MENITSGRNVGDRRVARANANSIPSFNLPQLVPIGAITYRHTATTIKEDTLQTKEKTSREPAAQRRPTNSISIFLGITICIILVVFRKRLRQ